MRPAPFAASTRLRASSSPALLGAALLLAGCARGILPGADGGGTGRDAAREAAPSDTGGTGGSCTDGEERPCYSGAAATRGQGVCVEGLQRCEGGAWGACDGETTPGTEACGNGADDDCDGETDEGCGECEPGAMRACYAGPAGTMGVGACRAGMQACGTDRMWGGCLGEVTPRGMELCGNMLDDDCNGMTDDRCGECEPGEVRPCYSGPAASQGRGRCVAGTQVCTPMRAWSTTCMGEVTPAPMDVCTNMLDDDCDGMIDEGCGECMSGSTRTCYTGPSGTMGVGACRSGTQTCSAGRMWPTTCTGEVRPAASETCGNALDDDCDGMVDEGCPTCTPPPNQTCATASRLSIPSSVTGNTACSAARLTSSCGRGLGPEVAYVFSTDGSANAYTFRMAASSTLVDPVLHLHAADACASADEIACNDDAPSSSMPPTPLSSMIDIGSLPEGSYYLVADGRDSTDRGTFTLSAAVRSVNNDTCGAAIPLTRNGRYRGTTTGKSDDYTPSCSSSNDAPDVIYTLRPTRSTRITVTTEGSNFDTVLSVGTTCAGVTPGAQQGCNDDVAVGVRTSTVSFNATAGTLYYILVDGFSSASGNYVLNVSGL